MKNWLTKGSWKTTSAGLLAIAGGVVRLAFAIKAGNVTEEAVMTTITTIIMGIGLLVARDNDKSSEEIGVTPADKVTKEFAKSNPPLPLLLLAAMLSLGLSGCAWFHPQDIKPVPVAAGQDAVVVNLERIQTSSLEIYKQTTEWELANRNVLPAEVSRAVDRVRAEFPKAWQESRLVLADYKAGKGTGADINKLAAALSAAQASLLRLRVDGAEAFQLVNSIAELARLIQTLRN